MRAFRFLLIAAGLAVLLAPLANASVAVRAEVEELAEVACAVADGVVLDHSVSLDPAAGAIWTSYRVRVGAMLVGDPTKELVVRTRGGRIGTIEQEVIGSPALADGTRVVVFLGPEERGGREIVALAQGAFRVETDLATGTTTCCNSVAGLSLVERNGRAAAPEPLRMPLTELIARVATGRGRIDAKRRAARETTDRRLAAWRRAAERHSTSTRGRPGGAAD